MACYFPLSGYKDFVTGGIVFKKSSTAHEPMQVACGQCIGCRTDRQICWAIRISHEAHEWDENCFITLTYRDKAVATDEEIKNGWYMPEDGSLRKSHFQKFMKRLRKRFSDRTIRYYHCGEYGAQLDRPHYHACLFNLDFAFDQEVFKEENGYTLFISKTLEELWPYGFSTIGALTLETASYVAGYCMKKITGKLAQDHYLRWDEYGEVYWLEPEYATMSRRPGIGRKWLDKYWQDVFPADNVPVSGKGVLHKVPTYYQTIIEGRSPELIEEVKKVREVFMREHGHDYTQERLMQRYKVHKDRHDLYDNRSLDNDPT